MWRKRERTAVDPGRFGKRFHIEHLEERRLLAADTILINFQHDEATAPHGYVRDTGVVFGDRGDGLSYGWSSDHTDQSRERSIEPDQRLDTLIHFEFGQSWEIAVPSGRYEVTVAVGDPANDDGLHTINVEGVNLFDAVPDTDEAILASLIVTVEDGRLTIDQGEAADKSTRIDFVHIVGLPDGANEAPAAPSVVEPSDPFVDPANVDMEVAGFTDPDGDSHFSTDWVIRTPGRTGEIVWQALGLEGDGRLAAQLSDGVFINSLAGDNQLEAETEYELRARFRDDAGSVSAFTIKEFETAPSFVIFPLQLSDVASTPEPTWKGVVGGEVTLPAGASLRLEGGAAGEALLSISGGGEAVEHYPALDGEQFVRIVIEAGLSGLTREASDLTFTDGDGGVHTFYLPAVNIPASGRLDLWVTTNGATYFGTEGQTNPNFAFLARGVPVPLPYVVNAPGFVIEQVGVDYRLPVNIAFVPNPGPSIDDPLYYVTELYGSIQVVTRGGAKHEFATGLLDYNPNGPISGSGEQGLTGIAVERDAEDPDVYHLYVTMLWDNGNPAGGGVHYPKVERLDSAPGGLSMDSRTVLLNMQPETQGQSHQVSNVTIGPDGMLYVHNGDGFNSGTAQNLDQFRGKILRMQTDGSPATDNPFYDESDGINARDYVYAYGVRNPFGGAWRAADGKHYSVENGPSIDRMTQINSGVNYGWDGSNNSMFTNAIYNWIPSVAPVGIEFVQNETFAGSQFPAEMLDKAFVSLSGATYAPGVFSVKEIQMFELDDDGEVVGGPATFLEYVGEGRSTVAGLAAGPDGLYFSALYEDSGDGGPTAPGAKIYRIRYVNPLAGDYDIDGDVDQDDYSVWKSSFGSNLLLAADGNHNGVVDAADYTVWRDNLGATSAGVAQSTPASLALTTAAVDDPLAPRGASQDGLKIAAVDASLAWGVQQDLPRSADSDRGRALESAAGAGGDELLLLASKREASPAHFHIDRALAALGDDTITDAIVYRDLAVSDNLLAADLRLRVFR